MGLTWNLAITVYTRGRNILVMILLYFSRGVLFLAFAHAHIQMRTCERTTVHMDVHTLT